MCLFHRPLEFSYLLFWHTCDVNAVNLDFCLFVDVDIYYYLVLARYVIALHNVNLRILVTLLVEIALDEGLYHVRGVRRQLAALLEAYPALQVFSLSLLDAVIAYARDARLGSECHVEVGFVFLDAVDVDADVGEKSLFPIAAHCLTDFVARNFVKVAFNEP